MFASGSLARSCSTPLVVLALAACSSNRSVASSPNRPATPAAYVGSADQSLRLRGGDDCYTWLDRLGIQHQRLSSLPGVVSPVRVQGPIGGITFVSQGEVGVTCDCRMVLALDWSARALAPLGVSTVYHSGAYVYRTTRSGRPSLHARGLAIDVHGVQIGPYQHRVSQHFARGRGGTDCAPDAPALNQFECRLRSLSLFREVITPDHDADHHDHLHLGISPL